MKKILLSAAVIIPVLALVIGGTIAFYNDTETSSGNIFTAGSIDLKVDHLRQTYNGVDCETCSVNIWSSTATKVISGTGDFDGVYPSDAVALSFIHPAWLQSIPDSSAQWVWVTNPVLAADTTNGAEYTFQKKFNWNGGIINVDLDLALASDNGYKIVFNGTTIVDVLGTEYNYGALVDTTAAEGLMLPEVQNGENVLEITVRNKPGSSNPANNPAGLIFDLTVHRPPQECADDSEFQQACRLWNDKDLSEGDTFFNFGDVKPGDHGTNVISLHVYDNEAYICLLPINTEDNENVCNEAELEASDPSCTSANGDGELGTQISVVVWNDSINEDGSHQSGEEILYQGSMKDLLAGEFIVPGDQTEYLGLAWCAGTIPAMQNSDGEVTCDASGMNNQAQTDSFLADLELYAEQTRNNGEFSCEDLLED